MTWALHEVSGGSRISDTPPTNPSRKEKELEARTPSSCHSPSLRGTPPPPSRNQGGLRRRRGSSPATEVEEVLADPPGLGEWPSHTEPTPPLGGAVLAPREGRGEGAGPGAPRPPSPGGLQGPPRARGGLCLPRLLLGKAPARVQDGGERVGSQALATRSGPALPAMQQGEGREAAATLRVPRPRPGHRMRPPADDPAPLWPRRLCLAAAATASLRRAPAAAAAENGCQSGASRHATTGGGRAPRPARNPAPFRVPALSARAPGPSWASGNLGPQRGARGEGEGRLPARRGGGGGGWQGASARRALSVRPPHSACPVPSRGRGARVGQC